MNRMQAVPKRRDDRSDPVARQARHTIRVVNVCQWVAILILAAGSMALAQSKDQPAMAQPEDQPAMALEVRLPEVAALVEHIQAAYKEAFNRPQRILMDIRTVTRALDRPDIETLARSITVIQGDNMRTEMSNMRTAVGKHLDPEDLPAMPSRMVFLRTADELRVVQEGPSPSGDSKQGLVFKLNEQDLDPELRTFFGDPLHSLKMFDQMLEDGIDMHVGIYQGERVYVLRSHGVFRLQPGTAADMTFYVDPQTYFVVWMRSDMIHTEVSGTVHFTSQVLFEADIDYEFDVVIPDGYFNAGLDRPAQDISTHINKVGKRMLEERSEATK